MNGVEEITMSKFQAREKYQEYRAALKTHNLPYLRELKDAYRQLSKGHGIIDAFKAFRLAGLNDDGEPRLALMPAHLTSAHFHKKEHGGAYITTTEAQWSRVKHVMDFGPKFFCDKWATRKASWGGMEIVRQHISCKVPIVPAHLLPKTALEKFHILWEVEKWNPEPPKDPLLLRRLSVNVFAVVARWDLTELERSIINGRIR
jgi:hypothetical protein